MDIKALNGKSGIVTGGTSGFGFEIVKALVKAGAKVAVFSIDELPGKEIEHLHEGASGTARFIKKDILQAGAAEAMVEETLSLFGRLDFAVANAGFAIRFEEPLLTIPLQKINEAMRTQFEVFVIPFVSLALAAAKAMAPKFESVGTDADGHPLSTGSIVVTLSETALIPLRDDLLAYGAAKTACWSIMRSLAASLGPKNIRVNGIAPGFADTAGPRKFYSRYPKIREDVEARCHLKPSFMHPKAVVPAVMYLLSDDYVTGEVLALDGGYNINMCRYFQD